MIKSLVHQMRGSQFPFGEATDSSLEIQQILVKKRIIYRNSNQYVKLMQKVEKLKLVAHKNTINLRKFEDNGNGYIDLFYPYVPIRLEDTFMGKGAQTVKELHRQFIELAIYLAKNYILTSFSPERCGIITKENKTILKYFLPLQEIFVTDNIGMLERSVQLFNLQSMHYLDTLCQNAFRTSLDNQSQISSKQRSKFIHQNNRKIRKESQPVTLHFNSFRKFSANPLSKQMRKLSHLSKELSEFSEIRKRTKQSTRDSGSSFSTFNNLMKQSERDMANILLPEQDLLKQKIRQIKKRSSMAITNFKVIKKVITEHRSLSLLIQKIQ